MFQPLSPNRNLDEHARVSQMAQALRPFRNIDVPGFTRLALRRSGFDATETDRLWRKAATAELARRRAYPGRAA